MWKLTTTALALALALCSNAAAVVQWDDLHGNVHALIRDSVIEQTDNFADIARLSAVNRLHRTELQHDMRLVKHLVEQSHGTLGGLKAVDHYPALYMRWTPRSAAIAQEALASRQMAAGRLGIRVDRRGLRLFRPQRHESDHPTSKAPVEGREVEGREWRTRVDSPLAEPPYAELALRPGAPVRLRGIVEVTFGVEARRLRKIEDEQTAAMLAALTRERFLRVFSLHTINAADCLKTLAALFRALARGISELRLLDAFTVSDDSVLQSIWRNLDKSASFRGIERFYYERISAAGTADADAAPDILFRPDSDALAGLLALVRQMPDVRTVTVVANGCRSQRASQWLEALMPSGVAFSCLCAYSSSRRLQSADQAEAHALELLGEIR